MVLLDDLDPAALPVHACEVEQLLAQELAIVGVDEAVVEGAQALVPPQLQQRALAAQPARLGAQHALCDLGQVTQVERVVRLGGIGLNAAATSSYSMMDDSTSGLTHSRTARRSSTKPPKMPPKIWRSAPADGCGRQRTWWCARSAA